MVSRFKKRQIDQRNGALSAGGNHRVRAFFQLADFPSQFEHSRRSVKAVGVADLLLIPAVIDSSGIGEEKCRASKHGCGERTESLRHAHVRMDQLGLPVLPWTFSHSESLPALGIQRPWLAAAKLLPITFDILSGQLCRARMRT